jgi:hypothetical protein
MVHHEMTGSVLTDNELWRLCTPNTTPLALLTADMDAPVVKQSRTAAWPRRSRGLYPLRALAYPAIWQYQTVV